MARPKRQIILSAEADQDLLDMWTYWAAQASADIADAMLREIDRACTTLQDWPNSGRAREELLPGLRSVPVPPHVIFYRVKDDAVEIVRVLDGRRDVDAVFGDA